MQLAEFKNKHSGKRCFVVGNGPSLNDTNLDFLVDEFSFAMNRISLFYDKTKWRPSYFVCTTTNIWEKEWRKDILNTINIGTPSFVWNQLKKAVGDRENVHYIKCTHGKEVTDNADLSWWSYDITERVAKFGTSMLVALQIAVYTGFNPIYLIGADLGYKDAKKGKYHDVINKLTLGKVSKLVDPNHFVPNYGTPGLQPDLLNRNMIAAHKLALKATKKIGVKIYNATVGGELEIYPRVEYDTLF